MHQPLDLTRLPFPYADVDASMFQPLKGETSRLTPVVSDVFDVVHFAIEHHEAFARIERLKIRERDLVEDELISAEWNEDAPRVQALSNYPAPPPNACTVSL